MFKTFEEFCKQLQPGPQKYSVGDLHREYAKSCAKTVVDAMVEKGVNILDAKEMHYFIGTGLEQRANQSPLT